MTAINLWRGERSLSVGDIDIKCTCTIDQLAKLFFVLDADTLAKFYEKLETRHPDVLKSALEILAGKDVVQDVWPKVPGIIGLAQVYSTIISTVTGQTPEEEAEAEKKQLAAQEAAKVEAIQEVMASLAN